MAEKNKTKELKEKLFMPSKKGMAAVSADTVKKADEFCEGYKKFLDNSPVEREAVQYSLKLAKENGFVEFEQDKQYKAGDKVYYINRDKAIALAVIGKNGTKDGVMFSIAHIDSPRVDLNPTRFMRTILSLTSKHTTTAASRSTSGQLCPSRFTVQS